MDREELVDVNLVILGRIVSLLEDAGIPVLVAMWIKLPEYGDWRLLLASKKFDNLSFGDAAARIHKVLLNGGLEVWEIPSLFILKTSTPFIRDLRKMFRNTANVAGMRLGGRMWGDRFVDDALTYKIA